MTQESTSATCRICCANGSFPVWPVAEMMFGTREVFEYFRCTSCGTLQITAIPGDMGRYYPPAYYQDTELPPPKKGMARRLARARDLAAVARSRFGLGAMVNYLAPVATLQSVGFAGARKDSKILDVGCGPGILLRQLRALGFTRLEGLDAYRPTDLEDHGLIIRSGQIETFPVPQEGFDLLMFHHSLEHVPQPFEVLSRAREFLAPNGKLLVRVPVSDSFAWAYYGASWAQLDAPRHLHLFTDRSMALLAERAGLKIARQMRDSERFQFWASESYLKGLPLRPPAQPTRSGPNGPIRVVQHLAALALNAVKAGDQAVYVLTVDSTKSASSAKHGGLARVH